MTAMALFYQLHTLGASLAPYPNGTVRCRAPKGVLTLALLDAMHEQKAELHALVELWAERAAIMEYDGGLSWAKAERLAWECVLDEALRRA